MTIRISKGRGHVAALLACSLFTSILPISAFAEYGIPAGSGAVVTTGAPLTVRVAPGWDAEVSYEIADGSYVTVWEAAQTAPDGSLWYPVDGGFVPVDAVTSTGAVEDGFALFQTADTVPTEEPWTEPAQGWIDPATGLWVDAATAAPVAEETWTKPVEQAVVSEGWLDPNTGLWVEPATEGWTDPNTGLWVEPTAQGWVDPATGLWVDAATTATDVVSAPAPEAAGWIDPNTGLWVDAAAVEVAAEPVAEGWIDPATGLWVDATTQAVAPATDGWVDPATGQWVAAPAQGWIDPNTGLWVDPNAAAPVPSEATLYQETVDPSAIATDPAAMPAEMAVVPETTETWTEAPVEDVPITEGWVEPVQDPAAVPVEAAPVVEDTWTEPVATDYVVEAPVTEQWVEPAPVDTSSNDSWSEPIGTAYIAGSNGEGAACRVSAERGSDKIAVLGEGEAVEVRGEAIGEWQPVNCAGMGGYVNTAFIAWQPAANDGGGRRNRTSSVGDGGTVTSNGDGQSMANFAMQYVGYPYVYAGEGPYAFDCSGFTKFVAMNTLGIDITHDMFAQYEMGQRVERDELQPGDLVFFQNTFRPGMSHNGIYIGDGQMVHAENESTGVKVSDINSDYYSSRWLGAVRLT